jgi:hypothetical protein
MKWFKLPGISYYDSLCITDAGNICLVKFKEDRKKDIEANTVSAESFCEHTLRIAHRLAGPGQTSIWYKNMRTGNIKKVC